MEMKNSTIMKIKIFNMVKIRPFWYGNKKKFLIIPDLIS